ncbi:MAG TPA: S-adenosylmethionine:tRNA ribosyltransferase-isomerase [Baekduia sp.]|uniref:S-adenosylmethionine:tRNA ribosyltransferase-isomerase n=1 Tax=Baekduia sp. TaxID=2600305 RepID=UPI002D14DBC3|nr:S-adenosylmethionine:tRNA ribosyltransferase-isomerase [Baekduia sp.]HMJ37019.1 S-adenosylmethionine:tRNA ribosyltransferase-isomerase [Baekduia sp.]
MSAAAFALPSALEAREPPEARGIARDAVRLMVAARSDGTLAHRRFTDLPDVLGPGDVLVVNTSATLPAAVDAHRPGGAAVQVRFATAAPHLPPPWWVVEVRTAGGAARLRSVRASERLALPGGASAELVAPYASGSRLWLARLDLGTEAGGGLPAYLARHGAPIRYPYVPRAWPLSDYQTAFATDPGSAEMPSAGRPFTPELIARLVARGVRFAPVTLHTGVSSPERHEPPYLEAYAVGAAAARLVNAARGWGGRIVAVGTTAVRALETVAAPDGTVVQGAGWTGLVLGRERGLRAVDGLITGWHEPHATHLQLLEAVAGAALLDASYRAALERGYLWHEFGDSHLVLP